MPKLTLNDITSGYQTATLYNANNALIEAAFDNTLSLDGTTPNALQADLDMNSFDINNAGIVSASQLNGTALVLGGQAVAISGTLTGGLAASEVTYDSSDLNTKLNTEFVKTTGAVSKAGALTLTDVLTASAGAVVSSSLSSNLTIIDTSRVSADGLGSGRIGQCVEGGNVYNMAMGRNIEFGAGQGMYAGRSGDGIAYIGFITDTVDGDMEFICAPNGISAGTSVLGTDANQMRMRMRSGISPSYSFEIAGTEKMAINSSGVRFEGGATPMAYYDEGTFTPTVLDNTWSNLGQTYGGTPAGRYTRIGNMVFFDLVVTLASYGSLTTSSATYIGGLPFNSSAFSTKGGVFVTQANNLSITASESLNGILVYNTKNIELTKWDLIAGTSSVILTEFTAGGSVALSGFYSTDDP